MKLERIEIKNFRGIRAADIEIGRHTGTLVTGMNESGKTTLLSAISEAMTGRCFDASGKIITNARLLSNDAQDGLIDLLIVHDKQRYRLSLSLIRKGGNVTKTFTITGADGEVMFPKASSAAEYREAFFAAVADGGSAGIDIALNPALYLLGGQDFDGPLVDYLLGDMPADEVIARFVNPDWLREWLARNKLKPAAVFDLIEAGNVANEVRKAEKRRLGDLEKAKAAPLPECPEGAQKLGADEIEGVKRRIMEVESERSALLVEIGRNTGITEQEVETLSHQIADIKGRLEVKAATMEKLKRDVDAAVAAVRQQRSRMEEELSGRTIDELVLLNANDIAQASATLDMIKAGACPCRGTHPECNGKLPKEFAAKQRKIYEAQLAKAEIRGERLRLVQKAESECADMQKTFRNLDASIAADTAELAAKQARAAQQMAPDVEAKIADAKEKLKDLDDRLQKGRAIAQYLESRAKRDNVERQYKECEAEIAMLTAVNDAYRLGRDIAPVLAERSEQFTDACRPLLERFDLEMALVLEGVSVVPHVRVLSAGSKLVPLAEASKMERTLACLAVADTFSDQGIVTVDDVDGLDGANRARILGYLDNVEGGNIILAAAWSKPEKPDFDKWGAAAGDVGVIWMDDGNAIEVN